MQYFNPALLHKQADSREDIVRKADEQIQETEELIRSRNAQIDSRKNDNFKPFDPLTENYGMSDAVDDISNWWNGEKDKSVAAGNRALTYFTPRLVGSLGLAAVVSLLAGRKGGIMPALIGAVAGWFLGGPAMDFFQKTFGSKPEDVKKRTDDAKKENGTEGANGANGANGAGANTPAVEKPNEGNNGQQPPKQPQQQPPKQQPTPQQEQPAEDPQEPTDEEGLIEEQGGEIPTTGGNPVEDPGAYGLPEEDPDGGVPKKPAAGQHPQQPEQPQQLTEEEELIREQRQRDWERRQEQELEQLLEETQGEWGQPQQPQQPPQPAPAPAPGNSGQPVVEQPAEDPQGSIPPEPIPPEPIPPEPIPVAPEQPAEDPTAGGAAIRRHEPVRRNAGWDVTGIPQLVGMIRGTRPIPGQPQTEARAQTQQTQQPQQPAPQQSQQSQQPQRPQQAQRSQMTAEEWQQQVVGRMRIPGMPMKTPEMQLHEYAYNIPEKTAPSYSYLGLGRKPSQEALTQAYPDNMVKEYATSAASTPFGRHKSPDDLRQEMYYNDQRGLVAGRKPQGRPVQVNAPAGKFTLKRNAVYNDLLRQYRGQPKVGPYRQN